MKRKSISKPAFSKAQMAAAIAAAPDRPVLDDENPPTKPSDLKGAIVSRSWPDLKRKLEQRRKRGLGKRPPKVLLSVRYSPEVVALASGIGDRPRFSSNQ